MDPTGLTKLADPKLLNKAYDDLLAAAMQEGGKALADVVKTFRLFTAPIQLLAVAQDRLARYCERVRQQVPEERQIEAPPSLALPVLSALRFIEDENPLIELYLNLLARAIDRERIGEVHPAFVSVIEQLSPDEAMVLFELKTMRRAGFGSNTTTVSLYLDSQHRAEGLSSPYPRVFHGGLSVGPISSTIMKTKDFPPFPANKLVYPKQLPIYAEHLASLNLVSLVTVQEEAEIDETVVGFQISKFGQLFVKCCLPENFNISTLANNP